MRLLEAVGEEEVRPDGVVGDSSPSSSSSSSVPIGRGRALALTDVDKAGRTGTVGSAEFGASPSVANDVAEGAMFGDVFVGGDFPAVEEAGAADDVRRGGEDEVVVVVVVVGLEGGRGGCGLESWRWEMDWTRLCPCTRGGIEAPK